MLLLALLSESPRAIAIGWVLLLTAGWLAATVSGAAGFGGALLLLPVLVYVVGAKAAVPVLTLAQLLGNLSRAGFGWKEIRWRSALVFSLGAVPASVVGSRLFVALPPGMVQRLIGVFLLGIVALRHTPLGRRRMPEAMLAPAGIVVGFLSAIAGSAGPLGAVVFLNLQLPAQVYVATEAITAVLMHLTKSIVYRRYAAMAPIQLGGGLALGGAMMFGSWTGRKLIERLTEKRFSLLVEVLLIVAALSLAVG
ncbi:sulfite exporter TauE/SafE family protein [Singulisphaera acidiphila]|uniref:Probable membrane transporter protein n=1 Tax=Singulisphaera acidiphila (strain ATCC BAA-1392 / DSM 18658 / VKM B-2454 / MOB10) TaxID=886293 RepID=L0DIS9_SINAD|nr:sulfite exporter TauE/SafE family protein [Singulisphaera acidiphila]AGA28561.1 putative permease [Singulisphaera acidiphila DSM 18658]